MYLHDDHLEIKLVVVLLVYREQWYVIISGHRPGLTDNLLEAGCTNKLCPIPVKLPLLTIYLRILLP